MAVMPYDVLSPKGEIQASLFPDDQDHDLLDRMDAYILEAIGKNASASDEAIKHWVYYRSYRDVFVRLSGEPIDQQLNDQGLVRMSKDQITNFNTLALENLAKWNELIEGVTNDPLVGLEPTGSVTNKFRF